MSLTPDGLDGDLRGWLEPPSPALAARLIAETRAEAERIVRARLMQAWTDVLLDGVGSELQGRSEASDPADRDPSAALRGGEGVYVHCVVGLSHPPPAGDLPGIEPGTRVRTVAQGELVAVVSPVPLSDYDESVLRAKLSDLTWLERVARAHERVQRAVARDGTPIPMRLCTIYHDEAGVRDMLTREQAALMAALAHLEGRTEWGIQAFADPDAGPAPADDRPAATGSAGAGEGASYLQSRLDAQAARERSRQRLDEICRGVHQRLTEHAVDAVLSPPQRSEVSGHRWPMILNGAYLVSDADLGAFDAAVREVTSQARRHGLEIRRTGPWPPYNFVPGAIGAAW